MKKGMNIALGAIAGAAIGVVAGVLTAPKSGRETREDIKQKTNDVADQLQGSAEDVRKKVTESSGGFVEKVQSFISNNESSRK